jgi:hypothetical protein
MPNEPPWTPDQPLPDKDDEAEVDREARARARLDFLRTQYNKEQPGKKPKRKGIFSDRD